MNFLSIFFQILFQLKFSVTDMAGVLKRVCKFLRIYVEVDT